MKKTAEAGNGTKLNTYVIELWHEPGISPLSSPKHRKMSGKTYALLPGLLQKRGMKSVGAYHLDPEHRTIAIWEAKTVEDVRDVLYASGFMHWCDGRIYPATQSPVMEKFLKLAREGGFESG